MKQLFTIILFLVSFSIQAAKDSIAYTRDYEFKEGIFLTLQDFLNNTPILKSAIVSNIPKTELDFLKQLMEYKYVVYKDTSGAEQKIETSTLWGYCQNRTIYLNFNKEFNRVNVLGTLFHFTAVVTTITGGPDPMDRNYGINPSYDEVRQFVYDSQTNKVYDFSAKNMEVILKTDPALHSEFMKLKKRKKADSIFIYLRKFNEKHPLYLAK